ncbi:MAG: hypothetical protein WBO59_08520, partial [Trichococcus flocculiformis]
LLNTGRIARLSGISPGRYTEEPRVRESLDRMITENRKTPDRMLLCRVNAQDSIPITQSGPNCRLFGIIGRS